MKEKQSFVFYRDWSDVISKFDASVQLEIYQSIIEYAFDEKTIEMQPTTMIAFGFIKPQIDRDTKKYNAIIERNRENGKYGGRPKKPKKPNGIFGNPKNLDNDNDNDNDNESENDLKELSPDSELKKTEEVFSIIDQDKDWKNRVIKYHKLKSEIQLDSFVDTFYSKLKSEGINYKSVSDTKKHFSSWLKTFYKLVND